MTVTTEIPPYGKNLGHGTNIFIADQEKEEVAVTHQLITTKKQCMDLGMRTESLWFRGGRMPKRGAQGMIVKGETFFSEDETEELVSRTEAGRRGVRPASDPVGRKSGCVGHALKRMEWEVFRISDCVPK